MKVFAKIADKDGFCVADDCNDNDPNIPTIPGTLCNDGNPNTENDIYLARWLYLPRNRNRRRSRL